MFSAGLLLLLAAEPFQMGPARLYEDESRLEIRTEGDKWLFRVQSQKDGTPEGEKWLWRTVTVSKNGRYVRNPSENPEVWGPYGNFWKLSRPRVKSPYPIIAIRGHYGLGMHWDTVFYRIRQGKLETIGRPPAANSNGPVNWQGKPDYWIFDDFDWYTARDDHQWRRELSLYRIDRKTGRLRFVSKWRAPGGRPVRDTVRLNDW